MDKESDGICILSFDNGGPGTYSQLLILQEYMSRLASDLCVAEGDVYPADYFDLMGGVGFGGLVALMLGHLRMSVNEAIEAFVDATCHIFPDDFSATSLDANTKHLREAFQRILQSRNIPLDTKMNDEIRNQTNCKVVLYAATSADLSHPRGFRTYTSRGSNLNPTIVDAVCATMALPDYFSPIKIGPHRRQQSFVGGAPGANNPTRLLLEEASKIYKKDQHLALLLSLGCGVPRVLSVTSSDGTSVDRLIRDLTADCEMVANELATRLFNVSAYLRLNVNKGMENVKMHDWNDLGTIESHTVSYLGTTTVSEELDSSLRHLQNRVAAVTLSQLVHFAQATTVAKKAPPVSPYFVPRKKPWEKMVHHLVSSSYSGQRIFPITGMGGCGKTQLVSYFLQEHAHLYAQTIYVDASSSSSIKADFQTWARSLGDDHERDVWEEALQKLNSAPQHEQWVLVLDNADDPALDLLQFLPKHVNVTIIITSRNHNLGNLSTTHLELGEMNTDEALAVMLQAARRQIPLSDDEMESAQTLLKELGCLAVALVQAGTYCRQLSSTIGDVFRPYTFTQYLSLFYSHRAELMKEAGPTSLDKYQHGVYTTLDLSYKVLPQDSRDFLHLISFFHHTEIPLTVFIKASTNAFKDPDWLLPRSQGHVITICSLQNLLCKNMGWNELRMQRVIHTLRSFSLLTASSMDDSIFLHLHPLVQAWSRDMVTPSCHQYQAMAIQVLTACESEENLWLYRYLLPHILDMLDQIQLQDLHANCLIAFGKVLQQQGYYQRAALLFETALELMKLSNQSSPKGLLRVTSWLAHTYLSEGRWSDTERLRMEVLEQHTQNFGTEHPETISAASDLAAAYGAQGQWDKAEELQITILEQSKRTLGVEHPDSISAASSLAATYGAQGRWADAEELQAKVLGQFRRVLGVDHPNTIAEAANLAMTYAAQGTSDDAEKLQIEVLGQRQRILGVDHLDTIAAAANLASTYRDQRRWNNAERLKREVLEQRRRVLGVGHPDTITAAANLALTYHRQGRREDAERLEVEVLGQRRRILGKHHPHTIMAAANLAMAYYVQGKWSAAEQLEVEVFEYRKRTQGIEHANTLTAAANLAATYGGQGRWEEDATLLAQVVRLSLKILSQQHPDTQTRLRRLAFVYEKVGKLQQAEEIKESLDSRYVLRTQIIPVPGLIPYHSTNILAHLFAARSYLSGFVGVHGLCYHISTTGFSV